MLVYLALLFILRNVVCTDWILLEDEMGLDMNGARWVGMTDEEIVDTVIQENTLPVPGQPWVGLGDGNEFTCSPNVTYAKVNQYLQCFIEFDLETGNIVQNTSFIEMYNENNILEELFIGKILMNHLYMLDTLPYNCTLAPVTKIIDIIYDSNTNIIRIHVIEPKLTEYMTDMALNLTNKTLYDLNRVYSSVGMSRLAKSLIENNASNNSLTVNQFECYELDSNGEPIGEAMDDSFCESEDIISEMGTLYGTNGFIDPTQVHTGRRRLIFGRIKRAVQKHIIDPIKDFAQDIINFVETIIDIITGDVEERFTLAALHVSKSASFALSGELKERKTKDGKGTLSGNGEFTVEAGAEFNAELYIDFAAKYKLFSLNPSFDHMRAVIGVELLLDMFLNVDLSGELNLEYQIFEIGKRQVFFIGPIPVVIETFAELTALLDILFDMSLSFNAGIEPIVFEFGAEFNKGSGWDKVTTVSGIVPYFNTGAMLGDNDEEDSSTCFSSSALPTLDLTLGVTLYELLTLYTSFKFENDFTVSYPATCSETDACALTNPQLGFDMSGALPIAVGIELGSEDLGLDPIGIEFEIASIDLYSLSTCIDAFIAPLYYPCCGYPDILSPTPNPTSKPTFHPTVVTPSPTRKPTLPQGDVPRIGPLVLPATSFDATWTRAVGSGVESGYFNGLFSFFDSSKTYDRKFFWYYMRPRINLDSDFPFPLISHSYTSLGSTAYDAAWTRQCGTNSGIVQITSSHSNSREDRVFNIKCAKMQHTLLEDCSWKPSNGYLNNYKETIVYLCPHLGVMTGIKSIHSNSAEDRRFAFRCCNLVYDF